MLSLFKKAANRGSRAGIHLGADGLAVAVVKRRSGGRPLLEYCAYHACSSPSEAAGLLPAVFARSEMKRVPVSTVARQDDYQLVQIEAPDVLPAELRSAVRWKLKDVIDFSLDDAVVDVFEIPDQSRHSRGKMLFAVAAKNSAVQDLVTTLSAAAKQLDVIDIPELCLRNLGTLLEQDQKGVALLNLGATAAQLILARQGVIYLTRRVDYGKGYDEDSSSASSALVMDPGRLALELQRSLDYYESHYDQPPIGDLVLMSDDAQASRLSVALSSETSLRIDVLDLTLALECAPQVDPQTVGPCLLAIGAALRSNETAL